MVKRQKIKEIKDKREIKEIKSKVKIREINPKEEQEILESQDNEDFQSFMSPQEFHEFRAPVLEKVQGQQEIQEPVNLEENISTTNSSSSTQTEKNIGNYAILPQSDYNLRTEETTEERNYERKIEAPVLRTEFGDEQRRVEFLDPLAEMRNQERTGMEPKMIRAEIKEDERRLPFERQERKYRKVKF